jgi:hypothetical protein
MRNPDLDLVKPVRQVAAGDARVGSPGGRGRSEDFGLVQP